jgi:hypothetical protein
MTQCGNAPKKIRRKFPDQGDLKKRRRRLNVKPRMYVQE